MSAHECFSTLHAETLEIILMSTACVNTHVEIVFCCFNALQTATEIMLIKKHQKQMKNKNSLSFNQIYSICLFYPMFIDFLVTGW